MNNCVKGVKLQMDKCLKISDEKYAPSLDYIPIPLDYFKNNSNCYEVFIVNQGIY